MPDLGPGEEALAPSRLAALGAWSARHHLTVIGLWFALLVAATVGAHALGGVYSDTLTIPGSAAQQGLDLLRAHDRSAGGQGGQVVFVDRSGVDAQRSALEQARVNLERLPHVLSVSNPLSPGTVSPDGTTAYSSINFDTSPQSLGPAYMAKVDGAAAVARRAGAAVYYGGALGQAAAPKADDAVSELIGIAVALGVLLVGFGSVLGALLPLGGAIVGVFAGLGVLGMLAAAITFGTSAPTLATMIGLGVGIDYALFLTTRHRQRLIEGDGATASIRATLGGSGRSVLIAACTVVVAMCGLYASGITYIGKLGLAAGVTVAVAASAALTLGPALLGLAGHAIDRFDVRPPVAEPSRPDSLLHRYTAMLARHPWRWALAGIALLAVIAVPMPSMHLGHVGPGSEPRNWSERRAYDAISASFGPGANGPFTIVAQLPPTLTSQQRDSLASTLHSDLAAVRGVASVGRLRPEAGGTLLVGPLIPSSGPTSRATESLLARLQDRTLPAVLAPDHATGYVTGTTAATIDFQNTVSNRLPIIIAIVIAAAFVLLLATFRSPVLALKAALLNLASISATYGVIVAVFQWGWGAGLLGVSGKVPIESYAPMIIFAIVFGLSMDYEVFLVSRIREHWRAGVGNQASVAVGLSETARVISCAALIMASVFFAFLLSSSVVIKMLALGLGVSVILDATVIRLLIVPSLMFVFDAANWWTPAWLDRILPRLEPVPAPAVAAASRHLPVGQVGSSGGGFSVPHRSGSDQSERR